MIYWPISELDEHSNNKQESDEIMIDDSITKTQVDVSTTQIDRLRTGFRGWSINITPTERWGRILIGGAGAIFGVILLASAASVLAVVLEVLLIAAGADLIITGALGHCPLYAKLGHVPTSLKRSS